MRPPAVPPRARPGALAVLLAAAAVPPGAPLESARGLPPLVCVSRDPVPDEPGVVPGLGPHHRAVITRGRLLLREAEGRLRELAPSEMFLDVSDPSVSRDGRRVAFAAVRRSAGPWRIWVVDLAGGVPQQVTFDDQDGEPASPARGSDALGPHADDLDPCWVDDSTLVFASTRYPQRAQYADLPVTNLFATRIEREHGGWGPPRRLTAERNGAEEPAMDWRRGRVVFARWWFNRHRAPEGAGATAIAPDTGAAGDSVNLWQAMEISPRGSAPRLAAGDLSSRRGTMAYQPAVLEGGAMAAVYADNLGLSPRPAGTGIHLLPRLPGARDAPARRLAGPIVAPRAEAPYGGPQGLAPPAACAPAGLPDGRVLFSFDPGARGDFGLYVIGRDGAGLARALDLPGTLELDAAPVVKHPLPPPEPPPAAEDLEPRDGRARLSAAPAAPATRPAASPEDLDGSRGTFRYHALDVFAEAPPGSRGHGAAPRTARARLRFFATLSRPDRPGGDTAVLLREVSVGPGGEVDERDLPADVPMFEQLVGPGGRPLVTARGPAHVAGLNAGVPGTASRCLGCHLGHSTLLPGARGRRAGGRRP